MGRPKKYERDAVLKEAMQLFWRRGFAGTGLQDLEKVTGVNKSGLYAEFKGKEDIFLESLRYYYANRGDEILMRKPLGWHNIENFFKSVAAGWSGERGCIGINSLRELEILPGEARKMVSVSRVALKDVFAKNIAAEKPRLSSEALAEIVATFFSGFCIEQNLKTTKAANFRRIEDFTRAMRQM